MLQVMCTEYLQERKELIVALHKDRKLANLPKITQVILQLQLATDFNTWLTQFFNSLLCYRISLFNIV